MLMEDLVLGRGLIYRVSLRVLHGLSNKYRNNHHHPSTSVESLGSTPLSIQWTTSPDTTVYYVVNLRY